MTELESLRKILKTNHDMQPKSIKIGKHEAIIIDDFFKYPDAVRAFALSQDYSDDENLVANFPGLRAIGEASTEDLETTLHQFIDSRLKLDQESTNKWMFSALTKNSNEAKFYGVPHADPSLISVIVWLSPKNRGGTGFYRHRETGLDALPMQKNMQMIERIMLKKQIMNVQELYNEILKPDNIGKFMNKSDENWKLLRLCRAKFNRALLFPSKIFHSQYLENGWYGQSVEQGRLTLTMFLYPQDKNI